MNDYQLQNPVEDCLSKSMTATEMNEQYFRDLQPSDESLSGDTWEAAVCLITSRAPELFEQCSPDEIITLAKQVDELDPQLLVMNRLPETPFPVDSLLGMGEAVKVIAETMKFPVAMVSQGALGLANAITQGLVNVRLPSVGPVPTSLYLITGNESGEGKTTCVSILSEPLKTLMQYAYTEYEEKLKKYHNEMAVYKSEIKAIENGKKKG